MESTSPKHRARTKAVLAAVAVAVASLATLAAALADPPAWVRVPVVLAFCLLGPGALLLSFLDIQDTLVSTVVLMVTGICLWTIVATTLAFSGVWAPEVALMIGAVVLLIASVLRLRRIGL